MRKINLFNTAKDINWRASLILETNDGPLDFQAAIKEIELPAIGFNYSETGFGSQKVKVYGETAQYNDINVKFLVDEKYTIVSELYNWAFKQANSSEFLKASLTLQSLDSYQRAAYETEYGHLQITSIDAVPYVSSQEMNEVIIGVTFSWNGFNFKSLV